MVQRLVVAFLLMAACRAQGIISTIAGNGTEGFSGNGGPATAAALAAPQGVAVDAAGNVYFAETVNYLVRMVNPAGVISSAAGCFPTTGACIQALLGNGGPATGAFMSPFDVATDKAGNFYFPDGSHDNIRMVTPAGILSTIAGNGKTGHTGGRRAGDERNPEWSAGHVGRWRREPLLCGFAKQLHSQGERVRSDYDGGG
jgi:hypothetical protein